MRILSWNVNGLRACGDEGLRRWLARSQRRSSASRRCAPRGPAPGRRLRTPGGWHTHFVAAEKRRLQRRRPLLAAQARRASRPRSARPRFDAEGRLQIARFGRLVVANVYFPNGSGSRGTTAACPTSSTSTPRSSSGCNGCAGGGLRVLVMGDFNTAHHEIDLARPKRQPEDQRLPARGARRARPLDRGRLGRHLPRTSSRARTTTPGGASASASARSNVGWRIDYVLRLAGGDEARDAAPSSARRDGLGPLPGRRRRRPGGRARRATPGVDSGPVRWRLPPVSLWCAHGTPCTR